MCASHVQVPFIRVGDDAVKRKRARAGGAKEAKTRGEGNGMREREKREGGNYAMGGIGKKNG